MRPHKTINITEALTTLALLEGVEGIKITEAANILGLSVPTIKRHIRHLREMGVEIEWSRKDMAYIVGDWGIFNRQKALELLGIK